MTNPSKPGETSVRMTAEARAREALRVGGLTLNHNTPPIIAAVAAFIRAAEDASRNRTLEEVAERMERIGDHSVASACRALKSHPTGDA